MLQSTPLAAQVGAPDVKPSPVAFGTGPTGSEKDNVGLEVLSVPPPGEGPVAAKGGAVATWVDWGVSFVAFFVFSGDFAAKLRKESPKIQSKMAVT